MRAGAVAAPGIKAVLDQDLLMIDDTKIPIPLKKKTAVKAEIEDYLCKRFEEGI